MPYEKYTQLMFSEIVKDFKLKTGGISPTDMLELDNIIKRFLKNNQKPVMKLEK